MRSSVDISNVTAGAPSACKSDETSASQCNHEWYGQSENNTPSASHRSAPQGVTRSEGGASPSDHQPRSNVVKTCNHCGDEYKGYEVPKELSCNCKSYNRPDWGGDQSEVVVATPEHLRDVRSSETICLDPCIADTVQYLWKHNVVTLSSCCGHNLKTPSIVIADGEDSDEVRALLDNHIKRDIAIMQWRLVEVGQVLNNLGPVDGDAE